MLRASPALALALLLCACGSSDEAEPNAGEGVRPSDTVSNTVNAACKPASALPEADATAVRLAAESVTEHLRAGQLDAIWDSLHPQARQDDRREAFMAALASMQHRLQSGSDAAEVEGVFVVDIDGGASALARVRCGADDDPQGFTLLTNAGNQDVAVATVRSGGDPFGFATTVQLRRQGATWKLLGVNVGLDTYRGRDAAEYEGLADAYVRQQRVVEAYLALTVAEQLAKRGESIKPDRALAISDKLDSVATSREFQQQLGVWELGGRQYDIQGFSVTATQSDLSAVVRYVTPTGLIQEALDQEADALVGHLKMQHPEIAKRFDAVIFEAYDSEAAAAAPGSNVQAYRTARVFKEQPGTPTSRPG